MFLYNTRKKISFETSPNLSNLKKKKKKEEDEKFKLSMATVTFKHYF
jgi:hypothetical protein